MSCVAVVFHNSRAKLDGAAQLILGAARWGCQPRSLCSRSPPPRNAMRLGPATAYSESVARPGQAGGVPSSPFEGEEATPHPSRPIYGDARAACASSPSKGEDAAP